MESSPELGIHAPWFLEYTRSPSWVRRLFCSPRLCLEPEIWESWAPSALGMGIQGFIWLGPGVLGSGRLKASKRQRSSRGHVLVAQIREAGIRGAGVLETEAGGAESGGRETELREEGSQVFESGRVDPDAWVRKAAVRVPGK